MTTDWAALRRTMVDRQVRTFDVMDQDLMLRLLAVPREAFVPPGMAALAYSDHVIEWPIEGGPSRAMLPPLVLARMLQACDLTGDDRFLDVSGAAGYTAALAAGLVKEAIAAESDPILEGKAASNLAALGITNAKAMASPAGSPPASSGQFDVIFVNGAVEEGLSALFDALAPGGRLVAIHVMPDSVGRRPVSTRSGAKFLPARCLKRRPVSCPLLHARPPSSSRVC